MSSDYGGDYNSTGESSLPVPNVPDSTGEGSSTGRLGGSTQPAGMSAFFPSLQENPPQPAPSQQQKSNDSNEKGGRGGGRAGRGGFPRDANGVPNAPDDWTCSSCQNKNYARRQACNRCKAPKPGTRSEETRKYPPGPLSKEAVIKSNGRYHEGDWACAKCCNINWAKRQVCNSCGQSKPTDEGPREGRGGGFNEREEVKYKSSRYQDDDDKYDDMGRLKKQYRSGARSNGGDRPSSPGRDRRRSRSRSRSPRGDYRRSRSPRSRSPPRHRSRSPPRDRDRDRDRDRSRSPYERRYYRRSRSRSPRSYDRDYDRRRDYRPRSRSPRRDDYRRSPPRRRSRSRSYERR